MQDLLVSTGTAIPTVFLDHYKAARGVSCWSAADRKQRPVRPFESLRAPYMSQLVCDINTILVGSGTSHRLPVHRPLQRRASCGIDSALCLFVHC